MPLGITFSIVLSEESAALSEKVRENRLRRMADRYGLRLIKSRSRDPRAVDYSLYALIDVRTGGAITPVIAGRWACSWSLDQVSAYLTDPQEDERAA